MLRADGVLSPFARMQGLQADRSRKVLENLTGEVLKGAHVEAINFERFTPETVRAGFALSVKAGERDSQDRLHLEIGDPSSSLNDPLHAAEPLYENTRGTTVHLPSPLEVVVEVHLDAGELEVITVPEATEISNSSGSFHLEVGQGDDGIFLRRSVRIEDAATAVDEWTQLRDLLLANSSPKNRTLLLK